MPAHLFVPDQPISISDLLNDQRAQLTIKLQQDREMQEVTIQKAAVKRDENRIGDLQQQLQDAIASLKKSDKALKAAEAVVAKQTDVESRLSDISMQLGEVEQTNSKVAENKRRLELTLQLETFKSLVKAQTEKMDEMEAEKQAMLAAAEFPLQGLTVSDELVTFNGIPFQDCAASEQLKISLAIGMTINPTLRVMRVIDGSLLDEDNLELVRQVAKSNDYQIWLESCQPGIPGIIIEQGKVANATA
jgi:hypothetical protein